MADSKRYWRESVGVVAKKKGARRAGAEKDLPEKAKAAEPTKPSPPEAKPTTRASRAKTAARKAALAPVAELLDSLPVGSMDLGRQVANKLWSQPTPEELRWIGIIAEHRHLITDPTGREAVLKAVVARQRLGTLLESRHLVLSDPLRLEARASEWDRLVEVVEATKAHLPLVDDSAPETPVIRAARDLLPPAERLLQESALCGALAGLVESVQTFATSHGGEEFGHQPLATSIVPESGPLLEQLRTSQLGPEEMIFLELTACLLLAHQDMAGNDTPALERDRMLLAAQGVKLEEEITQAMTAHRREPERTAKLAAWRRRLLDCKSRVDERLTAPGSEPGAAPTLEQTDPLACQEDAMREHLRGVRQEAREQHPPQRKGWRRWLPISFGSLVALSALTAAHLMLPERLPPAPDLHVQQFEDALPLADVGGAGALLIATADPGWREMDTLERSLAAIRLATVAEKEGFQAGLLMSASGEPLASWMPGEEPQLRRPLGIPAPQGFAKAAHGPVDGGATMVKTYLRN